MENLTMDPIKKMGKDFVKELIEDLNADKSEYLELFHTESTPQEQLDFSIRLGAHCAERLAELEADMATVKNFTIVLGVGLIATMILVDLHLYRHDQENKLPMKQDILKHLESFEYSTDDRTEAEFEKDFIKKMKDLGYTDYKWQRKFINKEYGKKLFK